MEFPGFPSILFDRPDIDAHGWDEPDSLADLRLDTLVRAITGGRSGYDLVPLYQAPLRDAGTVRYRQEVVRDLEREPVAAAVRAFAEAMRGVRADLERAGTLRERRQRQRWFLAAARRYCDALRALTGEFRRVGVASRGLGAVRDHLADHLASEAFTGLAADTEAVTARLAEVTYCVHIKGTRVTVTPYAGEADLSREVERTFAKFRQGAAGDHRARFPDPPDLNPVEARVLDLVAQLHPEVFRDLDDYCRRHADFLDEAVRAFDREVQFYLAYLEFIAPLRAAGLEFCRPTLTDAKDVHADRAFDLALADRLVARRTEVVRNDFFLKDPERVLVVTGPNQGGKTTFARMFGQLHYLAALGLPVPAARATLRLPDRILTHFPREEDATTLRGTLEDELVRVRAVLDRATGDSIVIMNESFASTTLRDAVALSKEVMRRMAALDLVCLCVTFLDELASWGDTTASMVGTVAPDDPVSRTYAFARRPADGLAHAVAMAERHGLSYPALRRRIAS